MPFILTPYSSTDPPLYPYPYKYKNFYDELTCKVGNHAISLVGIVNVYVPQTREKKLDFLRKPESGLFMLRNKNTYPL